MVAGSLGAKSGLVLFFLRENRNHSHEITEVIATFVFTYERIIPTILLLWRTLLSLHKVV